MQRVGIHKTRLLSTALFCVGFFLSACSAASEPSASPPKEAPPHTPDSQEDAPSQVPPLPIEQLGDIRFEDVLAEYQRMNERLDRVSARIRLANVALCPNTFRDPGFSVHTLEDYPDRLQSVAKDILGLGVEGIYVRAVRAGSPAAEADIEAGDRIISLNGQYFPGGKTMKRFYAALSRGAFGGTKTRLTLQTPEGNEYTTALRPDTACDYGANVMYSQSLNGHTDGQDVYITSELMRGIADDVNLALIIAHEMAHAIAGHIDLTPSAALELEADRMALVLMENAGYDIDLAIDYWADAAHPHRDLQDNSDSHPTIMARFENFKKERARIKKIRAREGILEFE